MIGRNLKVSKNLRDKIMPYLDNKNGKTLNSKQIALQFVADLDDTLILARNNITKIEEIQEVIDAIIIGNELRKPRSK